MFLHDKTAISPSPCMMITSSEEALIEERTENSPLFKELNYSFEFCIMNCRTFIKYIQRVCNLAS